MDCHFAVLSENPSKLESLYTEIPSLSNISRTLKKRIIFSNIASGPTSTFSYIYNPF